MDFFLIIGLTITVCIIINVISAYLISYKCQRAILESQVRIELKLATERAYIDQLKINLEDYLRKLTKIQKKDHLTVKKLRK